jgi:predicted small metal-binding protein
MARSFACRDDGEFPECPVVVRGETDEEVIGKALEHGHHAHGMTEEQKSDPRVTEGIRSHIREGRPPHRPLLGTSRLRQHGSRWRDLGPNR